MISQDSEIMIEDETSSDSEKITKNETTSIEREIIANETTIPSDDSDSLLLQELE